MYLGLGKPSVMCLSWLRSHNHQLVANARPPIPLPLDLQCRETGQSKCHESLTLEPHVAMTSS
jgi:hypothetical protein